MVGDRNYPAGYELRELKFTESAHGWETLSMVIR